MRALGPLRIAPNGMARVTRSGVLCANDVVFFAFPGLAKSIDTLRRSDDH